MAQIKFTAPRVNGFTCPSDKAQAFLWDADVKGLGLRATPNGKPTYIYQSRYQDKSVRLTIGSPANWTIPLAQEKARQLQRMIDQGQDPRSLKADEVAKYAKKPTTENTLEHLLNDYCDYLKSLNRISHAAARSIFRVHVMGPWPKVAALPANEVTGEQVADMMRLVIQHGKDRTANKLRSYMRSAYQVARTARSKASIPVCFKAYDVKVNPVADTEPDESANRADKNPLNADELRTYWNSIKNLPGYAGAVLRLHLLTGGQRLEQLRNLLTVNCLPDNITLMDGKGRPGKSPRPHAVPLIKAAADALHEIAPKGVYALSHDGGETRLGPDKISRWANAAGAGIKDFHAKRIRSGVETLLASARVSTDTRGRLQSHGISGVQARHYDGFDYMDVKREALEKLFDLLEGTSGQVIKFRAA